MGDCWRRIHATDGAQTRRIINMNKTQLTCGMTTNCTPKHNMRLIKAWEGLWTCETPTWARGEQRGPGRNNPPPRRGHLFVKIVTHATTALHEMLNDLIGIETPCGARLDTGSWDIRPCVGTGPCNPHLQLLIQQWGLP